METLQRFLAYAGDFEKSFADDDWARLRPHFADDAVYEVAAASFPCRLVGPAAIFAGFKKSLDGFDRRFDGRDVAVTSGPEIDGDELRVGWAVTYSQADLPPFVLRGHSTVRRVRTTGAATSGPSRISSARVIAASPTAAPRARAKPIPGRARNL